MRIPLQVLDNGLAIAEAALSAPRYRIRYHKVTFVVDTGSTETIISEADTIGFTFSLDILPRDISTSIMNVNFNLHRVENVALMFLTDEPARVEKIELPKILVARATKREGEQMNEAYKIPSLLGVDFLLKNRLRLVLSPHEKIAYLEKIEGT